MDKKLFLPLSMGVSPVEQPKLIRTYRGEVEEVFYPPPPVHYLPPCVPKKTEKLLSKQPKIELPKERSFSHIYNRDVKKACPKDGPYDVCVKKQRTPTQLKFNALVREEILRLEQKLQTPTHNAKKFYEKGKLVKFDSPMSSWEVRYPPKPASPSGSAEQIYIPSEKMMSLKRPRSGIYINETKTSKGKDTSIPFPTYNPRELQAQLDRIPLKNYDICETDDNKLYVKTPMASNTEKFDRDTCCCYLFKSPVVDENDIRDDCIHYKPRIFEIPYDLELTFQPDVIFGSTAILEDINNKNYNARKPMAVAAIYAAYATLFISYPGAWTSETIDEIINTGIQLHTKSNDTGFASSVSDFDVIPEILEKNTTICMNRLYTQNISEEQPNLLKVLTKYLEYYTHLMFECRGDFLLLFKICESVFGIFDPRGRNMELIRNDNGNSSLIIVRSVEHVYHYIVNKNTQPYDNDLYKLYELKLINFGLIQIPLEVGEIKNNNLKYFNIINKFYSIIPGKIGIEPPKDKRDLNASIMVAYIAIVYSHIDPPRHWPRQIIDNLIKFGAKYYSNFLTFHELDDMNIKDLPNVLILGTYRALIHKYPFTKNGHIKNCTIFSSSTLGKAIRDFFTCENYGILQIDNSNLAIWRDDEFFYVFDPFQRGVVGQVIDENDGAGCLQMHITLTSLCKMIYNNALQMITEGNFFIHAMQIESINVLSANKYLTGADKNPVKLQIFYPIDCDNVGGQLDCDNIPIDDNALPNVVPAECLSSISVKPCMRACSETEFLQSINKKLLLETEKHELLKQYSLKSLQETEKIPEYGAEDIGVYTAKEIICDVIMRIAKKEDKEANDFMKARKVLLKSDVGYLEDLKDKILRGDDYFTMKKDTDQVQQISLVDELAIKTNFIPLPDGNWAIFGKIELEATDNDFTVAAIAALLSTVTSLKYRISSWNGNIIDFIIDSSKILQNEFEPLSDMVKVLLKRNIPKITLGSQTYKASVQKLYSGPVTKLKHILAICLANSNKVLVLFSTFSCAVYQKNNFYYLFVGLPCDIVGFRSAQRGNPCLMRFVNYDELIRRINFNRLQFNKLQKFVILNVHVRDVTQKERDKYLQRSPSQEVDFYQKEVAEKLCRDKRLEAKLNYINDQITQEKERIKLFLVEKNKDDIKKGEYEGMPEDEEEGEGETEAGAEEQTPEHKYKQDPEYIHFTPDDTPFYMKSERTKKPIEFGYRLRSDDCLYKIQGTTSLEDRLSADTESIKTCYIAGVYAILSAILRPLSRWDYRRIDTIIENATELMNKIKDKRTACDRRINKMEVDDYIFNINVRAFLTPYSKSPKVENTIRRLIGSKKKYFLLQISNTTYAIYKDQYYHLFDPYPSMEINSTGEEEKRENAKICPKGIKRIKEQNSASWILFATLNNMLDYIDERATNPDWRYEFKFHIVEIINFKKGSRKTKLAQFLVDLVDDDDEIPDDDNITCIKPEKIKWLDIYPEMVPWSRLTRTNILKQERGTLCTKEFAFDIEIPNELYSLWGSIHPLSAVFSRETRGKQYLAINVIACCTASLYRITEWNREIIDNVVINGDKYLYESIYNIKRKDYELAIEDLNHNFSVQHVRFDVHIMHITWGLMYNAKAEEFNLSRALTYFLLKYRYGVILCMHRSLAFGKGNKGYFMFDCQSFDQPLFPKDEGAAYLLRCNSLQRLLHCMVLTLKVPYFNVDFSLFRVEVKVSLNPLFEDELDEQEAREQERAEEDYQ